MKAYRMIVLFSSLLGIIAVGIAQGAQPEFSITIRDARPSAETGLPVVIEVARKNISTHVISNNRYRTPLERYSIEVIDEKGNPMAETEWFRQEKQRRTLDERKVGSVILKTLKPGETSLDGFDVSRFYDMSQPGKYTIQVQSVAEHNTLVKSNTITVTVTK